MKLIITVKNAPEDKESLIALIKAIKTSIVVDLGRSLRDIEVGVEKD